MIFLFQKAVPVQQRRRHQADWTHQWGFGLCRRTWVPTVSTSANLLGNDVFSQRTAGYIAGVKSTCANSTVKRFVEAVCHLAPEIIKMPSHQQMVETAEYFEER